MTKDQLRKVRKAAGYAQKRMGSVLGYSEGHYRNIESGQTPMPKYLDGAYLLLKLSKYHKHVMKTAELLVGF